MFRLLCLSCLCNRLRLLLFRDCGSFNKKNPLICHSSVLAKRGCMSMRHQTFLPFLIGEFCLGGCVFFSTTLDFPTRSPLPPFFFFFIVVSSFTCSLSVPSAILVRNSLVMGLSTLTRYSFL